LQEENERLAKEKYEKERVARDKDLMLQRM
jgi:hypothetical protein